MLKASDSALSTAKYNRDTHEKGLTWRWKFWKCLHIDPNVIKTSNTDFFLSFFFLNFLFVNSSLMRIIPDFCICSWIPISSVPVPHQAFVWKAECSKLSSSWWKSLLGSAILRSLSVKERHLLRSYLLAKTWLADLRDFRAASGSGFALRCLFSCYITNSSLFRIKAITTKRHAN